MNTTIKLALNFWVAAIEVYGNIEDAKRIVGIPTISEIKLFLSKWSLIKEWHLEEEVIMEIKRGSTFDEAFDEWVR